MANNANGEERIQELEQQLEIEKQKYRIISGMVKCGLWEYTVSTGILVQCRLGEGMGEKDRLRIPHFRESMLSAGLIVPEDMGVFEALCTSLSNGDEAFSYDIRSYVDKGKTIWLRYEGYTVFDSKGNPAKVMGRTLNVDQEKRDEQVTVKEAEKDPVTGLLTENAFREKLEECVRDSGEADRFAFFTLNIDAFRSITDTYGNAYGEYILEKLAGGLGSVFMDADSLTRIADDEFVMLKKEIRTAAEVYAIARAVGKAAERIELKRGGTVGVNMGVAIFPNDGREYMELHKKALIALEEAKKNPNTNCMIYEESMEERRVYHTAPEEKKEEPVPESKRIVEDDRQSQYGPVEKYIVNKIFNILAQNGASEDDLVDIFGEIGKYYNYSRIYAVMIDKKKQTLRLRYNWEGGENPYVEAFETMLKSQRKELLGRFTNEPVFLCTNSAQLGMTIPAEMAAVYPNASLMQYAVINSEDTFACLTFSKEVNAVFTKEEQEILIHLSKLIGIFLERARTAELLDEEVRYARAIIENRQITNYAIKPDTFELVYVGDYTGRQYPKAHSGETCFSSIMGRKEPCVNCPVAGLTKKTRLYTTESYYEKQKRWISTTASIVEEKENSHVLVCWSDVTEFVERVRSKDALTGRLTIEKFEEEANRSVSEHAKLNRCFVSFYFPQFGDLNDVWGYNACNEILKVFAGTLNSYLKSDELFARINGANFMLMLQYDDRERTEARLSMMMESAHTSVTRLYPDMKLNVWCGIYRFVNHEDSVNEAMDRAKLAARSIGSMQDPPTVAINFFEEGLRSINSFREFVENSMRDAMSNREFKVFFQPKRDLETGSIIGAEALVRWITAEGQVIEPCSFQPIFEENGFVTELDYYVHKETCRLIREWLDGGSEPPRISMQLSWQYMFSADFMNRTRFLQQRYSIPEGLIEIVIPDGEMSTENFNAAMAILQELQNAGFHVEIDSYLERCAMNALPKDLPVSVVKQNPGYARLLLAMEQRRLSAPMPPEDFETLISVKKK